MKNKRSHNIVVLYNRKCELYKGGKGGGGGDRYIKRKKNLPECESVKVPPEEECGGHHHHDDEGGQGVHGEHFPQLKSKQLKILVIVVRYCGGSGF